MPENETLLYDHALLLSKTKQWDESRTSFFTYSKQYGLDHIGEIAEAAALKLELPPSALERYLRENIDFSLDAENLAGLRLYFEQCAAAGLIPKARPIEFAAVAPEAARRAQEAR